MYFLIGLVVSVISILAPSLIGVAINKSNAKIRIIFTLIATTVYSLLLFWVYWSNQIGLYGPAPFFLSIILGTIISMIISYDYDNGKFNGCIPAGTIFLGYIIYVLIGILWIGQSNLFHSMEKSELIGDVKTVSNLEELIKPADNKHIGLVSEKMAVTAAQSALSQFTISDGAVAGSRYKIGKPTKQKVDGTLWWIFPVEFKGFLKWKEDPQVPGYLRVSAENPSEQPQAVQEDKFGNEIHIKYLKSAPFQYKAERYLRENGYLNYILKDWTFEPDDNWRPYYTISFVNRTLGYKGEVTEGVITLDLQSGDITEYSVADAPDFIERTIPLDIIDYNAQKWGKYAQEGWFYNLLNDDKAQQPTKGWYLTYDGQAAQWFTGFTSMSSDDALTGLMVLDSRTGNSTFYKTAGVTEEIAYNTAAALWSNFAGYSPVELVPYNIYGVLTYVIPMESNDQFVGVSLISLNNVNIKAKGETLEEALSMYRSALNGSDDIGLVPEDQKPNEVQLSGVVERIGLSTDSKLISFKLIEVGKIFQVISSSTKPKALLLKEGDEVIITYAETTEIVVNVIDFDIPSIDLERGSVMQAEKIEKEKNTDVEVQRIEDQQKVDIIIDSDALKDVDPEELQKFLEEQQNKND